MAKIDFSDQLDKTKSFLKSKTIWGIIILALPLISSILKLDVKAEVSDSWNEIYKVAEYLDLAIGGILALWGRWAANVRIVLRK